MARHEHGEIGANFRQALVLWGFDVLRGRAGDAVAVAFDPVVSFGQAEITTLAAEIRGVIGAQARLRAA